MPRRKRGATMSLVIAVAVTIAVLGIGLFFLMKLLGGGREMSNATDAGALNIAKQAIRTPAKTLSSFSNADVQSNFSQLADNGKVDLLAYNRFVAQAVIVAVNAKSQRTPEAIDHAKKVWKAVNDVSEYLRTEMQNPNTMKDHFSQLASTNNTRMLGNSTAISLKDYAVGYMHRGGSTNVAVSSTLWSALANDPSIPLNTEGLKSPSGDPYLCGYKAINVQLPGGDTLTFAGVPVSPQVAPHLISTSDFEQNRSDNFISNYNSRILPPNAFRSSGENAGSPSTNLLNSVACAVVGVVNSQSPNANFPMAIPGGYIAITNGPAAPRPTKLPALHENDIFANELAHGIYTEGSSPQQMFTQNFSDPDSPSFNVGIWDDWYTYNTQGPTGTFPRPGLAFSQQEIRRGDGQLVTLEQLRGIRTRTNDISMHFCWWTMYDDPPVDQLCVDALDNFKVGYDRPGSLDPGNVSPDQFTTLEAFKVDVMAARYDVKTCANVTAPTITSGVKWFDHNKNRDTREQYSAPANHSYNFGVTRSPDEYLSMIEQVTPGIKAQVLNVLVQRCQEMDSAVTETEVAQLLKSQALPLGSKQYLFMRNNRLVIATAPPAWVVPGTVADGTPTPFGQAYSVQDTYINTTDQKFQNPPRQGDGNFFIPFDISPESKCTDKAIWRSATGYNNLLGELTFTNSCEGGGKFCKPN